MRKLTTLLGISVFILAAACGGQDQADSEMMDDTEPSGMMEESDTMMADTMMADTMEEGMPEEMMDEGEGMMDDDEMGGGS